MRICAAQTRPVKGDIQSNVTNHKRLINLALSQKASLIIFPELSITGYEPELAKDLAFDKNDCRLDDFQEISNTREVIIGVGVPTNNNPGICISMILFQPGQARQTYSKKYLYADEEEFFTSGQNSSVVMGSHPTIALAICYELSVPEHSANAFKSGANIYVASVVKDAAGVEKANATLSGIANNYSMTVLMSNCVGLSGGYECTGGSAVWNDKGVFMGQLNELNEGIIIFDTDTGELVKKTIDPVSHE